MATIGYDDDEQQRRVDQRIAQLERFGALEGLRILEIGPHLGAVSVRLAEEHGCEVVGIDPMSHPIWPELMDSHDRLQLIEGDIGLAIPDSLQENSFDLICSWVVWEHIRHPYTALSNCQRLLKPSGAMYLQANLYRSAIASHLYNVLPDPWPHLIYSPRELEELYGQPLGWAFWVNKLTYQQYLFYFRELGWHVTYEHFHRRKFEEEFYDANEQQLGLYPKWDVQTDFFEVLLEFDPDTPKQRIPDPVYRIKDGGEDASPAVPEDRDEVWPRLAAQLRRAAHKFPPLERVASLRRR